MTQNITQDVWDIAIIFLFTSATSLECFPEDTLRMFFVVVLEYVVPELFTLYG